MSNAQDKARRRSLAFHRRTDSGELDVFEAEVYFSASTENPSHATTITIPSSSSKLGSWRQGRPSLDMPRITTQSLLLDEPTKPSSEKKKHRQPISPGGILANFFSSIIHQTVSKKTKSTKSSGSHSVKGTAEKDNSPGNGWRRRRRSSISHLATPTTSDVDAKSIKSCPGYRINTPIKPYKESRCTNSVPRKGSLDWMGDKCKIVSGFSSDRESRKQGPESTRLKIFMEEDGDDSDSSSDLFELELNYDCPRRRKSGYCATELPVYESTRLDTIKLSNASPITNGPFRN